MRRPAIAALLISLSSPIGWAIAAGVAQASAPTPSTSSPSTPKPSPPIRPRVTCPTDVAPLTQAMLNALPHYINRLRHQRAGSQSRQYAIASSPANLTPLPVVTTSPDPQQGGLHQVFFTILERQYDTRRHTDSQQYYWLFLAQTPQRGWQLAILYTRQGDYPQTQRPASPLREATREVPGLAIRQWLRDCAAGSVELAEPRGIAPTSQDLHHLYFTPTGDFLRSLHTFPVQIGNTSK